jgi:hypothetical protein
MGPVRESQRGLGLLAACLRKRENGEIVEQDNGVIKSSSRRNWLGQTGLDSGDPASREDGRRER